VTEWLTLHPNRCRVGNPHSEPAVEDAGIVGLGFEVGGASH